MQENLELNVFDDEFVRLGGFWERFAAYFIDVIILGIAGVILNFIPILGQIVILLLGPAYFTYFYGTTGQTLGKKVLGLKVVKLDGSDLTYGKGFLRCVGYIVSEVVLCIGFLMIGWDKKKQGLHDKICGTTVVAKEKKHTIVGVILFLLLFILPIVLAVTIVIPKLMQMKNMAMQNAAQNFGQMPNQEHTFSSATSSVEKEEFVENKSSSAVEESDIDKQEIFKQEESVEETKLSAAPVVIPKQESQFTKEDALKAISEIEEKVAKVKSYRVDYKTTAIQPNGLKLEKKGYEICILPDKKMGHTSVKTGFSTENIISIKKLETLWQWSNKQGNIAYRIDLTKLDSSEKEMALNPLPDIDIENEELKKAIINGTGKLKEVDNIGEEKIYAFEESAETVPAVANEFSFLDKVIIYIGASDGLPKIVNYYNKEGKEFLTIFLNFSRINQISEDEFDIPSDWQVVDITDKFI